ncbi:YoaK family protein [Pandoraea sputorum]|uniref:YoaK family protein n=1 Tax=Pandoraea sputorum TaxID=93222 RepID=UPI001241574D|nr:YoaK family protein [Pandoraea sputorum]VVE82949.1 membrane protein [Pandoraea sputorum]
MLIRQGHTRNHAIDRRLACVLATVAGAVNTVAFHAVGFFSANMTGNVSTFSDRMAQGEWLAGAFYLSIVLTFILGASASTLMVNAGRRRNIRSVYALLILAEAVLLALLGMAEMFLQIPDRGAILVLGLSFLMGLQNAVVTRISDARVRTTHVSGMSTDIGIELGIWLDKARGRDIPGMSDGYREKLGLHVRTVLSFLIGGVLGVVLYRYIGLALLFVAAAGLFVLATSGIVRSRAEAGSFAAE